MNKLSRIVFRTEVLESFGDFLENFDDDVDRIHIKYGSEASGMSFFLEHLQLHFKSSNCMFLHLNVNDKSVNSLLNQIYTQLLSNKFHKKELKKFIIKHKDSVNLENILRTLAVCIPVIGPAFGIIKNKGFKNLIDIKNEIDILNISINYLQHISIKKPLIIVFDDYKFSNFQFHQLLEKLSGSVFSRIKFIIGMSSSKKITSLVKKADVKFSSLGYIVSKSIFPKPSPDFIQKLYKKFGIEINLFDSELISHRTKSNIYEIINGLEKLKKSQGIGDYFLTELKTKPTIVERKIIGYLAVAEQAIPESEIIDLLLRSKDISIGEAYSIHGEVSNLKNQGVLLVYDQGHDRLLSLKKHISFEIIGVSKGKIDYFLLSQQLYDYYLRKFTQNQGLHSLKYASLLYRLSSVCDRRQMPLYGKSVLRYSVLTQNFENIDTKLSNSFISKKQDNFDRYLIEIIYYVSLKFYDKALDKINSTYNLDWKNKYQILILEGICYNRLRFHDKAHVLLSLALENCSNIEEEVVLHSYLIANYLHQGQNNKAQNHFRNYSKNYLKANNYAYLMRNSAAAFNRQSKLELEYKAADIFKTKKNHYGYYSCLANAAATNMALKRFERANELNIIAFKQIEKYGIQHSVIITFNRMANAIFRGEIEEGKKLLSKVKSLPNHNLGITILYLLFYEILIDFKTSNNKGIENNLIKLIDYLGKTNMVRAKERLYANILIIIQVLGFKENIIESIYNKTCKYYDKKDPEITEEIINISKLSFKKQYNLNRNKAFSLVSPPYFAYWYMDEISLLSKTWLTN